MTPELVREIPSVERHPSALRRRRRESALALARDRGHTPSFTEGTRSPLERLPRVEGLVNPSERH